MKADARGRCSADLREQGARLLEPPTAPFRPLCSVPSPAPSALAEPSHGPSSQPRSPAPLPSPRPASSSNSCGARSLDSHVPTPHPSLRCRGAGRKSWRARRPRRRTSWAPHPRPSLAPAARLSPRPLPHLLSARPGPNPRPGPRGSRSPGAPFLGFPASTRLSPVPRHLSPLSLPARRLSPAPSWRRSWRPQLGARHSPGGRGAAPAPRARADRLPRAACPRASVQRAGACCPSPAGA